MAIDKTNISLRNDGTTGYNNVTDGDGINETQTNNNFKELADAIEANENGKLTNDFTTDLTQKSTVEGTEQIPISGTEKLLVDQIRESQIEEETANYVLQASDIFKTKEINSASPVNITIPPNSSVPIPVNRTSYIKRTGAGQLTFVPGAGVTINTTSGTLTDPGQNVIMSLTKTGTDEWDLQNGISATISLSDIENALGFNLWRPVQLSSDLPARADINLGDITGLSFPVVAGERYEAKGTLLVDAGNSTEGIKLAVNGPTLTDLAFKFWAQNATNSAYFVRGPYTAYDTTNFINASPLVSNFVNFQIFIECSASGNVQMRYGGETGAQDLTVLGYSNLEYRQL